MAELVQITVHVRLLVNGQTDVPLWKIRTLQRVANVLGIPLQADIS
jgi:hypothetical protein